MYNLKFEALRKLMPVGYFFCKINHELHLFVKFIVKEFKQLRQIFANRHVLCFMLSYDFQVSVDLGRVLFVVFLV